MTLLQLRKNVYRFVLIVILLNLIYISTTVGSDDESKVDADVWANVKKKKPKPVVVEVESSDSSELLPDLRNSLSKVRDKSKDRRDALQDLVDSVAQLLAPVIDILDGVGAQYDILPISNSLIIFRPITTELLERILTITVVTRIRLDILFKTITQPPPATPTGNTTWSHGFIDDRCQSIDVNNLGKNVIVGIIDYGVMYNHTQLEDNWLGKSHPDYGWLDATVSKTANREPNDPKGDGTSFLAVAVGKSVGVAPGANWVACRACSGSSCSRAALEKCVIYMACPWKYNDTDGTATKNCSLGANVVLYGQGVDSVGGQLLNPDLYFYYKLVQFWNALGIIPVFAMGDTGPDCNSAMLPGAFDISLSVGAIDEKGTVIDQSSRGPILIGKKPTDDSTARFMCPAVSDRTKCTDASNNGSICTINKPDMVAPGYNVITATITSTTSLDVSFGTGVAAAHVAGVLALMISANPGANWNHKTAYKILTKTADITRIDQQGSRPNSAQKFPAGSNLLCNLILSSICNSFPDNLYGWGILNACRAVQAAIKLKS